jgi:hypothetical protein
MKICVLRIFTTVRNSSSAIVTLRHRMTVLNMLNGLRTLSVAFFTADRSFAEAVAIN